MRVVRPGSFHETRLLRESRGLRAILRRVVRVAGANLVGCDAEVEKINFTSRVDIVGLVALRVRIETVEATLITAPGTYFGDPERRDLIDHLAQASRSLGRFTVVVSKHELTGRTPLNLAKTLRDLGADVAGPATGGVKTGRQSQVVPISSSPIPSARPVLGLVSHGGEPAAVRRLTLAARRVGA